MRITPPAEAPTTGNRSGARRSQCLGSPCQSSSRPPTCHDSGSAPVSDNSAEAGPLWMRTVSGDISVVAIAAPPSSKVGNHLDTLKRDGAVPLSRRAASAASQRERILAGCAKQPKGEGGRDVARVLALIRSL